MDHLPVSMVLLDLEVLLPVNMELPLEMQEVLDLHQVNTVHQELGELSVALINIPAKREDLEVKFHLVNMALHPKDLLVPVMDDLHLNTVRPAQDHPVDIQDQVDLNQPV